MQTILHYLKTQLEQHHDAVEAWFHETFRRTPPFLYSSVDIRYAGYKIAPVDTNVFPGGFNNLMMIGTAHASQATADFLQQYHPSARSILLIPENHTRNTLYLDNIYVLSNIIRDAGYDVILGLLPDATEQLTTSANSQIMLESAHYGSLTFEPLHKENGVLITASGKQADLIVINNDFTSGAPELLKQLKQPITPPVGMGWYRRRKTSHFNAYNTLNKQLCELLQIDPWLTSTEFHRCGIINFKQKEGIECLANGIDKVIYRIQKKYDQYGIKDEPYVFIKSDRGTYGMGIMTAKSGLEIFNMNKDIRNKMNTIKGGTANTEVIIQEGVPTIDQKDGDTAERMVYLIGRTAVGCLYRINQEKDQYSNLNARGMRFHAEKPHIVSDESLPTYSECSVTSLIAKLASRAASWECYEEAYEI